MNKRNVRQWLINLFAGIFFGSAIGGMTAPKLTSASELNLPFNLVTGDIIQFGRYEQNNYEDEPEEIEWEVLDVRDGNALLISRYGLDTVPYHTVNENVTWENSSLRSWLNDIFIQKAFNDTERGRIQSTYHINADNPIYNTYGSDNTDDAVFILNMKEAEKYFNTDESRRCEATPYAMAQGAYTNGAENCCWWLNTPGYYRSFFALVDDWGTMNTFGNSVSTETVCIRPCLWIKFSSTRLNDSEAKEYEDAEILSDKIDVTEYLGADLGKTIAEFENMSEPCWVMGTTFSYNDSIEFSNSGSEENGITKIVISGEDNPYSLLGISTNMSVNEMKNKLENEGFVLSTANSNRFYKREGEYLIVCSMADYDDLLRFSVARNKFGLHSDKIEVFDLIGRTVLDAMNEIDGLSSIVDDENVILSTEGLILKAKLNRDNITSSIIQHITIEGSDSDYCIYGISPKDPREFYEQLGFDLGGSGEYIDEFDNVLYMGDSYEGDKIYLYAI